MNQLNISLYFTVEQAPEADPLDAPPVNVPVNPADPVAPAAPAAAVAPAASVAPAAPVAPAAVAAPAAVVAPGVPAAQAPPINATATNTRTTAAEDPEHNWDKCNCQV